MDTSIPAHLQKAILCLIVLALLILAQPAVSAPQADATVRLAPTESTCFVGNTFEIEVWIDDVTDLYAADVRLSFDPTVLEVVDADPTRTGTQVLGVEDLITKPLWLLKNETDNTEGTVWYAVTQLNPNPPANGSGIFYVVTFRAKSVTANSPLNISYQKLADRTGKTIPASETGAVYTIAEPQNEIFLPFIAK